MTCRSRFANTLLLAFTALLPLAAAAQDARSSKWVNLRAGPDRDYPLVARLGPNTPLAVQGCTEGFGWCDVIAPDSTRGWIYGGNIVYPYQSAQVPVISYGAVIGVPIVTFAIGSYWNSYYRNRPWYGNRGRWENRPPPRPPSFRPPPRPPGFRPPPPPSVRPPGTRPPGIRPPGNNRPPPSVRPPGERPGAGGGRPPGGGDRPGGGGGGPRPQPR
jgi:uncharacterized protein YraI